MKPAVALLAATLLLGGCADPAPHQPWRGQWLEVEQHPPWRGGQYDGKTDQRTAVAHFHGDRLAWNAAITDRTLLQNEYRRTRP